MRGLVVLLALLLTTAAVPLPDPVLGSYQGRTIVTGTDMRDRGRGLAICYTDVLVKVAGDPTLAEDPRVAVLAQDATSRLAAIAYWDRKKGLPLNDEQGSSDRSYFLTGSFDPVKIDADIASLGRAPWTAPRPAVVSVIHVRAANGEFDLTVEEPRAVSMRESLAEAGQKLGMQVRIPKTADTMPPDPSVATVRGTLVFNQAALGWIGTWHLDWHGQGYDWSISGVNFDPAFRQMLGGAMQVLSGHGAPR